MVELPLKPLILKIPKEKRCAIVVDTKKVTEKLHLSHPGPQAVALTALVLLQVRAFCGKIQ